MTRIRPRIPTPLLAGAALLLLGGCGSDPDPVWRQAFGYVCPNHDGRGADAVCKTRPPGANQETVSRFCYETLGDANCFDQPDLMSKNQELGSSGK